MRLEDIFPRMEYKGLDQQKDIKNYSRMIDVLNNIKTLQDNAEDLPVKISKLDRMTQDILHHLEIMEYNGKGLNPVTHFKFLKELQRIRIKRRKYKNDLELIQLWKTNINKILNADNHSIIRSKIEKLHNTEKTYTYREYEDIEKEILGKE